MCCMHCKASKHLAGRGKEGSATCISGRAGQPSVPRPHMACLITPLIRQLVYGALAWPHALRRAAASEPVRENEIAVGSTPVAGCFAGGACRGRECERLLSLLEERLELTPGVCEAAWFPAEAWHCPAARS